MYFLSTSCAPGFEMRGGACEDVDECITRPCLHQGTCYNGRPGFMCICESGYTGDHCEIATTPTPSSHILAPAAIASLAFSLLLLGNVFFAEHLRF